MIIYYASHAEAIEKSMTQENSKDLT